jgi:GT2 family glycosyltransferase
LLTRAGEPQPFSYGDAPSLGYLLRRGTRALLRRDPLHRWDVAAPLAAEWVSAACVAVRAEAVRQVGPFDEGFFMYFEDVDWGLRLRRAGWGVIYDPCFPVTHLGGASQGAPRRIVPTYYRSLIRFHRKHYGWASALLLQVLLGGYVALLRLRTKG